ncbi:MAG: reductive dehalogenase domain-containing protein [bacterium]
MICREAGADLVGVAEIEDLKADFLFSPSLLEGLTRAVSIGFSLSGKVLETVEDHPSAIYYHHYRSVNFNLDQTALKVAASLQKEGWQALPIPASQIVDWDKQRGHLSHKKVAVAAGLGRLGRNNLLVTPEYGSRVRLVSILTDKPLGITTAPDGAISECGNCRRCMNTCPAQAIKERPEDFDHLACYEQLKAFRKAGYTSQFICGICVRACRPRRNLQLA